MAALIGCFLAGTALGFELPAKACYDLTNISGMVFFGIRSRRPFPHRMLYFGAGKDGSATPLHMVLGQK